MTAIEMLKVMQDRCDKATPGPWIYTGDKSHDWNIKQDGSLPEYSEKLTGGVVGCSEWIWLQPEDAEFIAKSRSDIPKLIKALEHALHVLNQIPTTDLPGGWAFDSRLHFIRMIARANDQIVTILNDEAL